MSVAVAGVVVAAGVGVTAGVGVGVAGVVVVVVLVLVLVVVLALVVVVADVDGGVLGTAAELGDAGASWGTTTWTNDARSFSNSSSQPNKRTSSRTPCE